MFLAHPKPSHPEYGKVDGAYVSCWIREPLQGAAETIARKAIEHEGWDIEERDQSYEVSESDYQAGSESLSRFQQATIDGAVFTFHRWPVGGDEDDES